VFSVFLLGIFLGGSSFAPITPPAPAFTAQGADSLIPGMMGGADSSFTTPSSRELSWTSGAFPTFHGKVVSPPLASPATPSSQASTSTHWYAGAFFSGSPATASSVVARIATPPLPKSDEFYYVLASVWDDSGSYDQIGFADVYGVWGLTYSWTSGPCSNLTYNFNPDAIELDPSTAYTFYITSSGSTDGGASGIWFEAWTGTTKVWSLFAPNGATALKIAPTNCGYYDYTNYEEVWNTDVPGGSPNFDFRFSTNEWLGSNWTASVWAPFSAARSPESVPSRVTVHIDGEAVDIANDRSALAAEVVAPPALSTDTDQPIFLRGAPRQPCPI